jgi:molybdopterin synthase sulfur carrier subunit
MKRIRLQYFALLRESAGRSAEERQSAARNLGELYEELRREYGFSLDRSGVRAAVDERYVPMHTPLREGMEITFIPPVAGG